MCLADTGYKAEGQRALAGPFPARPRPPAAFTLIELLVVLAIIGLLMAISLPAMKGIGQSNVVASANRQLLDDVALARQLAIKNRSVVHMVFVPPGVLEMKFQPGDKLAQRIKGGALTTYALFAERSLGDQPGQPRFRYLTPWKTLPDGVFIAEQEFDNQFKPSVWETIPATNRPFQYISIPFPSGTNDPNWVAHLSFDPQGGLRMFRANGMRLYEDAFITLARGSILAARDPNGDLIDFNARESPPFNSISNYNRIWIDNLTGRARVDRPEVQ